MFENIAFVVMAIIAAAAGIWVWWLLTIERMKEID